MINTNRFSDRIKAIVGEIEPTVDVVADIGCDHGLISIYSILSGKAHCAIGCDINSGPLESALRTIKQFEGLEKKIQLKKGNGLDPIEDEVVDTIVIAGMGGRLIGEILQNGKLNGSRLVLQPQRDVPFVRRLVHTIGYRIKNEVLLFEDNKPYWIISCISGTDYTYSETEYLLSKILIERKDLCLKLFLEREIVKLSKIIERAVGSTENEELSQKALLLNEYKIVYEKVFTCPK